MAVCPDNAVQYTTLQWRWFLYCNIKARTEYFFHLVAHRSPFLSSDYEFPICLAIASELDEDTTNSLHTIGFTK